MNSPKFFVPLASSDDIAESTYNGIKSYLKSRGYKIQDDRIFSVCYTHDGKDYTDAVGKHAGLEPKELIIAIFRLDEILYCICTPCRGVLGGDLILCKPSLVTLFNVNENI